MASRTTTDPIEILLEMGVDLDNLSEEEDYLSALIEAIATIQFQTKGAGDERSAILQKEVVKIRKQRKASAFKVRKTKISAEAFKKGTASDSSTKESQAALPTAAIIPFRNPKINLDPVETEEPEVEKEKEKEEVKDKSKNYLKDILKSVTNIADILKQQYSLKKKTADFDRKKAERERRDLQKKNLAKRFEGLKNVAQKIIAPVSSIFDKIFGFLFNILLGKFLMKLVDWFADPKNQGKIKSIIRFLTDNWPKLLSAYLIFGTGIGKFARFLVKILAKGAVRLAAASAGLLARLFGSRKLGKFSRFLGKRGGLVSGGIQAVATIAGFKALESAFTQELGDEESASIDRDIPIQPVEGFKGGGVVQPVQNFISIGNNTLTNAYQGGGLVQNNTNNASVSAYQGGGLVKSNTFISAYQGGGLVKNNTSNNSYVNAYQGGGLVKSIQKFVTGGLVKPTYKYAGGGGVNVNLITPTNNIFGYSEGGSPAVSVDGGEVEGPGGIDKVPAMLTAGEFVMSRGAVQKYGLQELESMNASGGGTNKPKMMDGAYYAAGGGLIGDREQSDKELTPTKQFSERFVVKDQSLFNTLTSMNNESAIEKLGLKIDKNTIALTNNTIAVRDYIKETSDSFTSSTNQMMSDRQKEIKSMNSVVEGMGSVGIGINIPSITPSYGGAESANPSVPTQKLAPPSPASKPSTGGGKTQTVSSLSKTQKEALAVLAKYESGAAGYDAVNQIGTNNGRGVLGFSGDIRKMEQYNGRSLTDFTIKEIKDLQADNGSLSNQQWINSGKLHAVGRYQFIGNTLPGVAQRAGIPDDAKFTSEVQDLLALQLMKERGISPWVGPSDKATAAERAVVESARTEKLPEVTGGEQEQMQIAAQQQEQLSVPPSPQDTPYIRTSARMGRISPSKQNMSGKTMTAAVTPSTPAFATIPAVSTTPVTTENITKLMSSSQSVMSEKTPVVTTLPGQSISITEGAPAAPILPGQSTPTESLIPLPPSLPAQVQKPSVAEIQNMDISTLNSFLDPGKTGASFPLVFAAARAAKEKARAQGMPENEVQRLGQVAAVTAKLYGGDTISKNTTSIGRDFNLNIPRMDISGMKNPFQTTYNNSNSTQLQKTQSKSSSLMNTLLGGDSQSSSTTNQYYENYTEALRGTEAKAPQLEATTNKLTIAPSQAPKVTVPEPPPTGPNGGPRVTVIKSGKKGKSPTLSGSGSETPYINPGNGNKSKFNILGIPVPFF